YSRNGSNHPADELFQAKTDPFNWKFMQTPIDTYVCPSAAFPSTRPANMGYTNYRGNMGSWKSTEPIPSNNGVFYMHSRISDRDFIDGMTTTIMFGETPYGIW